LLGEVLAVRGTFEMLPRTAITEVFDDVEARLDKFLASLQAYAV
jgi:hypothetical protein